MSSGIYVTIGEANRSQLPMREAICRVEAGEIIAVATWQDVKAGHYSIAHAWNAFGWQKTFHLDVPPAEDGATVTALVHISWDAAA